jgi:hypothetical protein
MISIALLSFIMLGVLQTTDNSQSIKERVIADDRRNLAIYTALSRLEWDFSHIFSPLFYSRELDKQDLRDGKRSPDVIEQTFNEIQNKYSNNENFYAASVDLHPIPRFFFPEKNTIIFFTSSNRRKFVDIKQSHFAWVKYTLEATADNNDDDESEEEKEKMAGSQSLVRYFYPDNPYNDRQIEWENMKGQVLMDGVTKLAFQFWDAENNKFTDNLELLAEGQHLIRGLRADITWIDNDGNDRRTIKVIRPLFPYFKAEPPPTTATPGAEGGEAGEGEENEGEGEGEENET